MIVIKVNDEDGAGQVYDLVSSELEPNSVHLSRGARGFDGTLTNEIFILASVIAPVAIKHIAGVLVSLIQSKSQREVVINGVAIKGYSTEDVARLLSASGGSETQPSA